MIGGFIPILQSIDPLLRKTPKRVNRLKKAYIVTGKYLGNLESKLDSWFNLSYFANFSLNIIPLAILVVVFSSFQSTASAQDQSIIVTTPVSKIANLSAAIDEYTPVIKEDSQILEQAVGAGADTLISKQNISETINSPYNYTVAKGDTISTIANKFGLNVSTVLEANDLKTSEIENIKVGSLLIIPPYRTSDSMAWLDELNKNKADKERARQEQAKKLAEAKRKAQLASSSRSVAYRESSSSRLSSSESFDGSPSDTAIIPISSKGISRGIGAGHTGIDYRADIGTPVYASRSGRVIEITGGWSGGWGKSVVLDHGGGLTTRYAHLSQISVSSGQNVSQGSLLGLSGSTGFSTGPHLHFEARINGRVINPYTH